MAWLYSPTNISVLPCIPYYSGFLRLKDDYTSQLYKQRDITLKSVLVKSIVMHSCYHQIVTSYGVGTYRPSLPPCGGSGCLKGAWRMTVVHELASLNNANVPTDTNLLIRVYASTAIGTVLSLFTGLSILGKFFPSQNFGS